MPRYRIRHTLPCYVTWTYEFEAENEADAAAALINGELDAHGEPEIGDVIDWMPNEDLDITEIAGEAA